jgi:aryl-alcohol dehydrogenase-like predicted oxidoreductase
VEYRKLGRTGLKVSELCLGTMTFGWTADEKSAYEVFSAFADAGGNFLDTADVYSHWAKDNPGGVAETYIGNWLKGQARDQFVIATKAGGRMSPGPNGEGLSRKHIMDATEESLRRLQTDHIDLYQCHAPDEDTPIEETLRALDDLVRQGKVRYIGCSNYAAWQVCKALWTSDKLNLARFASIQPHYNLAHRAEFEREMMALCQSEGLGVISYSSLAGGFLTGKYRQGQPIPPGSRTESSLVHYEQHRRYLSEQNWALIDQLEEIGQARGKTVAQMALGWMLTNPAVTSPIVGANNVTQLKEILGAVGLRLSQEEIKTLNKVSRWEK